MASAQEKLDTMASNFGNKLRKNAAAMPGGASDHVVNKVAPAVDKAVDTATDAAGRAKEAIKGLASKYSQGMDEVRSKGGEYLKTLVRGGSPVNKP